MKIAVIGGGIAGIAVARMLSQYHDVVVFEKNDKIGGLIRCDQLPQGLYHKLGGHVFNTRSPEVSDWFWSYFDKDNEFYRLTRNACILFGAEYIGYPIENHLYQLSESLASSVISDILDGLKDSSGCGTPSNFHEALLSTFGKTLCEKYFFPYNEKIWRADLASIPTGWLEGKLPMPSQKDVLMANITRKGETSMVHSEFYYPKNLGSQFIINRLSEGLNIRVSTPVEKLTSTRAGKWQINNSIAEDFDWVVSTADVRSFGSLLPLLDKEPFYQDLKNLRTRGITNVFCECDKTSISWLYLPESKYCANRIIYTGLFSPKNNGSERMTCVVEFVYGEIEDNINRDLALLPGNLKRVSINHVRDAYVIQEFETRRRVDELRSWALERRIAFAGRFADWEYYNIDKAIEAAIKACRLVNSPY